MLGASYAGMARGEAMNFYEIEVVLTKGAYLPEGWLPGRVFAVPGSCRMERLGIAIDVSLGRWDFAHEREFRIGDRVLRRTSTLDSVGLELNDQFEYEFDLGDSWMHACRVRAKGPGLPDDDDWKPTAPTAIEGWGNLPDQYGVVAITDDGPIADLQQPD